MATVLTFVQERLAIMSVVGTVLIGGSFFYVWYANQNGEEEVLVATPGTLIQSVSISGKVVPLEEVDLGFTEGGRITHVAVSAGDTVLAGDVLAEVDSDAIIALILQRKASLAAENASLDSLIEGIRPEEIAVSEAAVQSAEVALAQTKLALSNALQDAYRVVDGALRVHVDTFIENPRTAPKLVFNTANMQTAMTVENERRALESVLKVWSDETSLIALADAVEAEEILTASKDHLNQTVRFLVAANDAVTQGVPSGTITVAILEGYSSNVATARAAVHGAISSVTTAETAVRNAEASLVSAKRSLDLKRAGTTASALAAQRARVEAARALVLDAEAQLRRTRLLAPFDGVVSHVTGKVGAIAGAHSPLITLISNQTLHIESFVPEINIEMLSVGNVASVALDAYGESVTFPAKITALDPADTVRDGVSMYRALLSFLEQDSRIKAGMTASITITASEKENVIRVPSGAIFSRGGESYVFIKNNDSLEERPVVTGLRSLSGDVEIISGIEVGETVVLKGRP